MNQIKLLKLQKKSAVESLIRRDKRKNTPAVLISKKYC